MNLDTLFLWALGSASMFNTIILFWLGLTVLLNAERRSWGIWLAGLGLLVGGLFFAGHTATLDYNLEDLARSVDSWWYASWACVIAFPCGWYILMLWYAGYWETPHESAAALRGRQRGWVVVVPLTGLGLITLLLRVPPQRVFAQMSHPATSLTLTLGGVPLLVLIFPFYLLLCLTLSLDALLRPGPTARMMGDLARRRARPWLVASSVVQWLTSLVVAGTLFWLELLIAGTGSVGVVNNFYVLVSVADFVVTVLVGVAVLLAGKAIVSYEIFTGKTLPRRGFLRQWRAISAVAAVYSVLVCLAWALPLRPVYPLLLTTILMAGFYALFSWRSYVERESAIEQLRPFVASQHLYEHLLAQAQPDAAPGDAKSPFQALCEDVLGAGVAYLVALGPLAPLVGAPLGHPETAAPPTPGDVARLFEDAATPRGELEEMLCLPLDPTRWGGAVWAVPLWSERGLIGALLLGEKRDGGLYAQEEIELARAGGERLIDTAAGAALAQRLMALQRHRLAESQVLDRRARRMLHDDVLPRLHTAMLSLSAPGNAPTDHAEALAQLAEAHHEISNLLREMPTASAPQVTRLGLIGALRRAVEEELPGAFDGVTWHIEAQAEKESQAIPSLTAEVLFYAAREAIRNAARYGRNSDEARPLHLRVSATWRDGLELTIEDDGAGVGTTARTDGGSGQGLALHSTMMAVIGGALTLDSAPGRATRVTLTLPPGQALGRE